MLLHYVRIVTLLLLVKDFYLYFNLIFNFNLYIQSLPVSPLATEASFPFRRENNDLREQGNHLLSSEALEPHTLMVQGLVVVVVAAVVAAAAAAAVVVDSRRRSRTTRTRRQSGTSSPAAAVAAVAVAAAACDGGKTTRWW